MSVLNTDPFPRLAGVNNGGSHNYEDRTYQAQLSKLRFCIVGTWPGWNNKSRNLDQVCKNIKQLNPASQIFQYINSMEVSTSDLSVAPYAAQVESQGWWLLQNGVKVLSEYGSQTGKPVYQINNTQATKESDWHAQWVIDQYLKPNPTLDGFFEDNVFWRPRVAGDWNRDGTDETPVQAAQWHRDGYQYRFNKFKTLIPDKTVIGNIADWGHKDAVLTGLSGTLGGGVMEGILGPSYAPETWGGWAEMMRWYRKTQNALTGPKLNVFHMVGSKTDLQALRYGLASCLMDDGYFAFTDKDDGYGAVSWFPEYDASLGMAITSPATSPWQYGVYRRDFENGIALVNPKGNGTQTVTLETNNTYRQLDGTALTQVKLLDRDGVILRRSSKSPKSPILKVQ